MSYSMVGCAIDLTFDPVTDDRNKSHNKCLKGFISTWYYGSVCDSCTCRIWLENVKYKQS